ncbi:phytanoyl-CoA dioxygenase family protein [Actinopolymorpha sp. B9G3]|uniref:phytanoyl-CoA dioxygenase family protein n=1 Tax=Actinopolymorpha sp. B9G3 TaxID=3158970 RepID=UPI0032D936D1
MLTHEQRVAFDEQGLLRLEGAVPRADAERMAERVREFLTSEEAIRHNSEHEYLAEHPGGYQPLKRAGVFDAVLDSAVPVALDELFGPDGWKRPRHWGNPAVTYRVSDAPWALPTDGWHVDRAPDEHGRSRSVTVFVVLAELRPRGGGTLILTGSHQLVRRYGQHDVKNRAQRKLVGARHPWLAELWSRRPDPGIERRSRYLEEGPVVDGVPLRVVEITGQAGDTFLMRGDTFHAVAPNALDRPRIMLIKGAPVSA